MATGAARGQTSRGQVRRRRRTHRLSTVPVAAEDRGQVPLPPGGGCPAPRCAAPGGAAARRPHDLTGERVRGRGRGGERGEGGRAGAGGGGGGTPDPRSHRRASSRASAGRGPGEGRPPARARDRRRNGPSG